MKRVPHILFAAALLALVAVTPAVRAQPPCTVFISPGQALPPWIAPGTMLCLHQGDYPHDLVRITTSSATYQAAPGEHARLVATGGASLEFSGHDVTLAGLEIDNGGAGAPAIVLRGANILVTGSEIHNGRSNGIDVRGAGAFLTGNSIHDFDSGVAGSDAHCVVVEPTGASVTITANTIHDCSGDGVQAYYPNSTGRPADVPGGVIADNTIYAGAVPYQENAIDLKRGIGWLVARNHISSFGFVNIPGTASGNPAIFVHKWAQNVLVDANTISTSAKGIEVFGNSGLDAGAAPIGVTLSNNIFDRVGPGYLVNVSGVPGVVQLANPSFPSGLPSATRPATATRTASATGTSSPTASATLAPTGTSTPAISGCWDLRHSPPLSIPCPG